MCVRVFDENRNSFYFKGFDRWLLGKESDCNALFIIVEEIEVCCSRTLNCSTD